ncbi:MAG: DUF1343 domain-containing protein [Planctomycetaceae bacterium]|nr:DUF1343 domain-containing protein [Planctomycetaceae bacterium]
MNQASVDSRFRYACDIIDNACPGRLRRLFSPQHGFWGEQQANMVESADAVYRPLGLPVHSLYSETRRPSAESLADLDLLIIDLQDVGTRVYTFLWTMLECLRACAEHRVQVVVLDRPNPLGGVVTEGPLIESDWESFVGNAAIPMRHGLTMGELALLFNAEFSLGTSLSVVSMEGWRRAMLWSDTGRHWVMPSPNMPCDSTAVVYPGQVLLEGTNISEGRGTTRPFEICGAPWIDPEQLAAELNAARHPGVIVQPVRFCPTFDKWAGQSCGGVFVQVTEPKAVRSFRLTVHLLSIVCRTAPNDFRRLDPPYEYEFVKPPIDILFGSDRLRHRLENSAHLSNRDMDELTSHDDRHWQERVRPHLLYD